MSKIDDLIEWLISLGIMALTLFAIAFMGLGAALVYALIYFLGGES